MSDTPRTDAIKLAPEQRIEAQILIDRITGDESALEHFVYAAIFYRAKLERELSAARAECETWKQRAESAEAMHLELIMGVSKKYPDETRHQTALRYILNAENRQNSPDAGAAKSDTARGKV